MTKFVLEVELKNPDLCDGCIVLDIADQDYSESAYAYSISCPAIGWRLTTNRHSKFPRHSLCPLKEVEE